VRAICDNLYQNSVETGGEETDDFYERVAIVVSQALRVSYRLSKEIGVDKITFLTGLHNLMEGEDQIQLETVFN